MTDLIPGYAFARRGTYAYLGALRRTPGSVPVWTCSGSHALHVSTLGALACARAELDRRTQGGREVFWLRRCEPCNRWWGDGASDACPVCAVPMERVKVAVLERVPVS